MFHLFEHLAKFAILSGRRQANCDDFCDRLNRKYTIYLLLLCCAIISSKQYVGDPISCFCPSHFTGAHVEYTNNICWISNVYYVPLNDAFNLNSLDYNQETILDDTQNTQIKVVKVNNLIAFYPFVLLIQAVFFYIPYFLWKNIVNRSAYDIGTLINFANSMQSESGSNSSSGRTMNTNPSEDTLKYLIRHVDRASEYYSEKFNVSNDMRKKMFKQYLNSNKPMTTTTTDKKPFLRHPVSASSSNIYNEKQGHMATATKATDDDIEESRDTRHEILKIDQKHHKFSGYIRNLLCEKFLFTVYLIIKLFYLLNCFCQLLFLNKLITTDISSIQQRLNRHDGYSSQQQTNLIAKSTIWSGFEFGYRTIVNLVQTGSLFGINNQQSKLLIFHSVIFCDFKIRMLGDRLHKHTVQCVAPINIFTEKLFTILWFWLAILCIINLFNLLDWLKFYLFPSMQFRFIQNFLIKQQKIGKPIAGTNLLSNASTINMSTKSHQTSQIVKMYINDKNLLRKLLVKYLELDNLFVYKMISKNSNEMITQELITLLIEYYINKNSFLNSETQPISL